MKQIQTSGNDNTENTVVHINHINCESTDSDSDIENTLSSNITEKIIHDQTQTDRTTRLIQILIHYLGINNTQMIDQETHHIKDTEIIPTIGTEATQKIVINNIKIDHEITQKVDHITKDQILTIIKKDHEIIHKIGIQDISIDKGTTLNHLKELTHVIQILKTNKKIIHQYIRHK